MSATWTTDGETDSYAKLAALTGRISIPGPRVQSSTGSATRYTVLADPVEGVSSAHAPGYLTVEGQISGSVTIDLPNRRWLAIRAAHFAPKGKRERAARALAALKRATFSFGLDAATIRAIAEDPDLEYL